MSTDNFTGDCGQGSGTYTYPYPLYVWRISYPPCFKKKCRNCVYKDCCENSDAAGTPYQFTWTCTTNTTSNGGQS
jgi:hypothetical protein